MPKRSWSSEHYLPAPVGQLTGVNDFSNNYLYLHGGEYWIVKDGVPVPTGIRYLQEGSLIYLDGSRKRVTLFNT